VGKPVAFKDFFTSELVLEDTHAAVVLTADGATRQDAANWIASSIARTRMGNSPAYLEAWEQRRQGGPEHSPDQKAVLEAFIASEAIGPPAAPAVAVHLEGLVAEHIWYELIREGDVPLEFEILRVEEPSWSPTDSGGDGLVVYRAEDDLAFCLWESKAHGGGSTRVRDVVNGACRQVEKKAIRYLARMSKLGQDLDDEELRTFTVEYPRSGETRRRLPVAASPLRQSHRTSRTRSTTLDPTGSLPPAISDKD
jgi:hypothetical protein